MRPIRRMPCHDKRNLMKFIPPWAAVMLALLGSGPAVAQSPVPPAGGATKRPPPPVAVNKSAPAMPEEPNAIRVLLSPELETVLVAEMNGRIARLNARLGGRIAKGHTVVAFDCAEAAARLRMAEAEYASAKETLTAKEGLRKLDAAGDMEVSLATAAADKAKAAIGVARAQTGQCTVAAPFTGRVVRIHVKPHQGVNVGAPLVEMVSDGPLKIRLNVPSRWLRALREGTAFEVTINETGRSYPAHVTAINARVDAVAQTIELEARMDGAQPELLAGMSGIAHFKIDR
ncbi:MAG: efflux RND transporter periplasmic adaptor subunit [Thiomonas sp.]